MATDGRTLSIRQSIGFLFHDKPEMFFQEEEGKLLAFYTKGEEVVAVLTLGRDPLAARCKVFESKKQKGKRMVLQVCQPEKGGRKAGQGGGNRLGWRRVVTGKNCLHSSD